jgi:hypothetical protein
MSYKTGQASQAAQFHLAVKFVSELIEVSATLSLDFDRRTIRSKKLLF